MQNQLRKRRRKTRKASNINVCHQFFNLSVFLLFVIFLLPVVPISIILIVGIYALKQSEDMAIIGCLFFLIAVIIYAIFLIWQSRTGQIQFVEVASRQIAYIFTTNIQKLKAGDIFGMLQTYMTYTVWNWLIILAISFGMSAYVLRRVYKYKEVQGAGILSFEKKMSSLNKATKRPNNSVKLTPTTSTLLGYNQNKKPVYCSDNAKHVFVCGTTGSGKTILLSNFIKHGIEQDYGMLIVDGKGDLKEGSLPAIVQKFCQEKKKPLHIVNMSDPTSSCKYNPFAGATETMCKDMLINMSDWSEEHYKANSERYIQRLIKLLKIKGEGLSFKKIIEYIPTGKFTELSAELVKLELQTKEQHTENLELIKSSGKIAESAAARFSTIAESEIGSIFDEDGIDIYTAIRDGAVILFVLNPLVYPETAQAFGRLVLIDGKQAISKMFGDDNRKFFIFDETNVYVSTVLIDLINKSRSAGVTCIPATQSLADLEIAAGESFKTQIIENCNNYAVLRQNSYTSAEEWAKTLGTKETMKMTYQLSKTEATGMGSARRTREFVVHPDDIKALGQGKGIFLSRDSGACERVDFVKPF